MRNVANASAIARETIQAIKLDNAIAVKTGIANVTKPDSYEKTATLIVRKHGLLGGIKNLIDNNTRIDAGICSFDNKWLPKGETWIMNAIRILGSDEDPATVKPGNATFSSRSIDPAFQSSLFKIVQGKTLLDMPIRRFMDVDNNRRDSFLPLAKAVTLLPETPFNFTIEAPQDAVLSVKDGYLLFEFDITVIITNTIRQGATTCN